eukprot:4923929-Pyramimonas_sp.AAC.1
MTSVPRVATGTSGTTATCAAPAVAGRTSEMQNKEMVANPLAEMLEGLDKELQTETHSYALQLQSCSLHALTCRTSL